MQVVLIAAATLASVVVAQERLFPSSSPLAAAEAHGRTFARLDEPLHLPRVVASGEVTLEGSSERECVEVPSRRGVIVRSGEMLIGGSIGYPLTDEGWMKVWWRPLKSSEGMALSVVGQKLGSVNELIGVRTSGPTISSSPESKRPDDLFFPGGIQFSSAGKWVVVGTSGAQWGCFVFDIPERG
jgi:hypothetical protein